jgi:predicted aspartyl protease
MSMIVFRYVTRFDPPSPFVMVLLAHPDSPDQFVELPAQVDTGADRTVIPDFARETLGLQCRRKAMFAGFGGQVQELSVFDAVLGIKGTAPLPVEVLAHPNEPHVLLGRDVLNRHRIVFDGPNQSLEIEHP